MFFNPDPYVKIYVQSPLNITNTTQTQTNSVYSREYKTSVVTNTCFPYWKNDVILFLLIISYFIKAQ